MNKLKLKFNRLPTGLAVELLEAVRSVVNEPGNTLSDVSGLLTETIESIKDGDQYGYISDMIAIGKESLPRDYIKLVHEKLKTKGLNYSRSYIRAVLSPSMERWSDHIFVAFVEVLKEHTAKVNQSFTDLIEIVK